MLITDQTKKSIIKIAIAFAILVVTIVGAPITLTHYNAQKRINLVEDVLKSKSEILKEKIKLLSEQSKEDILHTITNKKFCIDQISYFVYQNDSLIAWSENLIPISRYFNELRFSEPIVNIEGNYYLQNNFQEDSLVYLGLFKIKSERRIENKFLRNTFNAEFKLPPGSEISFISNGYDVFINEDNYGFSIVFPTNTPISDEETVLILIILVISFLIVYREGRKLIIAKQKRRNQSNYIIILFWSFLVILKLITLYFRIPEFLYETNLFSPSELAFSVIAPSLGDLFINALLLLVIAWGFNKDFKLDRTSKFNSYIKILFLLFIILISYFLFFGNTRIIREIIINSSISFDLRNLADLSVNSIIGILIISILSVSIFIIIFRLVKELVEILKCNTRAYLVGLGLIVSIFVLIGGFTDTIESTIFLVYIFFIVYLRRRAKQSFSLISKFLILCIFSFYIGFILDKALEEKDINQRKLFALDLSINRDMLKEFDLSTIANEMRNDSVLIIVGKNLNRNGEIDEKTEEYVKTVYFQKYLSNYYLLITICCELTDLMIKPDNLIINCFDYFKKYIGIYCENTDYSNVYYQFPGTNYVIVNEIDLGNSNNGKRALIVIELTQRYSGYELGYPELLEERTNQRPHILYSHAIYRKGNLLSSRGKYPYQDQIDYQFHEINTFHNFRNNNYSHLLYRINDEDTVIVSKYSGGIMNKITTLSYLLFFYGFIVALCAVTSKLSRSDPKALLGFKEKIQLLFFLLIFFTFIAVGIFYVKNMNVFFNNRNISELKEKTFSIMIELEHKLFTYNELVISQDKYFNEIINKFSNVFFTDINLYNTEGYLIATSRPVLFELGLMSKKVNPVAYLQIMKNNQTLWIQHEQIGSYSFLSSYLKLRNTNNEIVAIINLPYFAKQTEFGKEVSDFFISFTSIYVFMIAAGLILTFVLSSYLLKPLQLLRINLEKLKLTGKNEKIEFKGTDEIGLLIDDYNKKVEELERNVEILAKTEREVAWKEMAMQVAHEIKNSLTPMKLNIQQLRRELTKSDQIEKDRIEKFSQRMLQQIESMTEIAVSFSSFASFPKTDDRELNLISIIKESTKPYESEVIIELAYKNYWENSCFVFGDEKQIVRAFDNLLQNAIQAVQKKDNGRIMVEINKEEDFWNIKIIDNGVGIKAIDKPKIFQPHFTTKSGGMGLGLAIVKKTISEHGGNIDFFSEENEGTTFIIKLPVYNMIS